MTSTIPGQFRLSQIQVYNWGTFDNLHTVDVAREGFLITGPSGSGKSTLIDAISTILVPPGKIRFNAAADNQSQSGRNLVTYCRGAWRREHSVEADELTQSFLREGATWTGVALRYEDGAGAVVTACRLMFLPANAHSRQDITDLYLLLPREADLSEFEQLALKNLPVTEAKREHKNALHVGRSHPQFIMALRRAVGIADVGALDLLHRTQSAKTLGDLNHLMRSFMLPEPETFAIAEQAAANFTDLHTAYESVVNTREQIDHLLPVRVAAEKRADAAASLVTVTEEREAVAPFIDQWRKHFAEEQRNQLNSDISALGAKIDAAEKEVDVQRAEAERLRTLIHGAEGAGVVAAEARRDHQREKLERVREQENAFRARLQTIDGRMPGSVEEFTNLQLQLRKEQQDIKEKIAAEEEKREKAVIRAHQLQERGNAQIAELNALRRHGSAMDARLLAARSLIAQEAGVQEKDLPFVADLVSIKPGEGHWQGTAERVMGGFARRIIVPDELYPQVSAAINATHLGAKVAYTRFTQNLEDQRPSSFLPGTLGLKVDVVQGRFYGWIQSQLSTRFDHLSCETMEEFRAARRAVTINGQVKHNAHDHIKDDRRRIDDRSNWVLWGNLDDKIDELQADIRAKKQEYEEANRQRDIISGAQEQRREQAHTITRLLETQQFSDIDVSAVTQELAEAQRVLDELVDGNAELASLKKELAVVASKTTRAEEQLNELREQRGSLRARLQQAEQRLAQASQRLAGKTVEEEVAERLKVRCHAIDRTIREDNIDELSHRLIQDIEDRLANLNNRESKYTSQLVDAMNRYLVRWPQRQGDLSAEAAWQEDFLQELERLEADDLPRFEQRFRDMLHDETHKHLGRLRRLIRDAAAKTRGSIQMINDSLSEVEFYPGTHLSIEVREAQPAIAREFVQLLDTALDGMINEADQEESEKRFHRLSAVIDAVTVSDNTTQRERRLRLDTREHVKFLGVEYTADGARGAVYDSSEGLSGGQAQKLSSFCLAAALRYRLTGMGLAASQEKKSVVQVGDEVYPRFGTIVLDEAFDRADTEFTRAAMEAFERFGFHMILATPEKLLQTVQDYIGGVLMVECPDRKRSRTSSLSIEEVPVANA